ncbi:MAG: ribosome-associated heat shock protein Hsp15 [Planctomycetota bacterium]
MTVEAETYRLDKWLWAARFFKTRALAADAIKGGKVHLQGNRVKPSRPVKIDDCYEVRRGYDCFEVVVTGLSARRGSALSAAELYRETDASKEKRKLESEKRKLAALAQPITAARPTKKQRRQIHRFKEQT